MDNKEEKIIIDYDTIGVKELRHLNQLAKLNMALTEEDYLKIVNVYAGVLNRLDAKLYADNNKEK